MVYRVYVIQNRTGKFYVGLTEDVDRRIAQHNVDVAKWTRGKGIWTLIWQSDALPLSEAQKLENPLKRQKGGHRLVHLIGVLPRQAHNPAPQAESLVQIQAP